MSLLWLVPALPFAGALVLLVVGARLPRWAAAAVGCTSVGLSWVASALVSLAFVGEASYRQALYEWIPAGPLRVSLGLYLDPLSVVMMNVVTFVGFLIHVYSVEFMREDDGYARFFGYLNLFVGAMLLLVLGDNLLSLYLGWEGVGLCSYLLIGFWYRERANGRAARKAFLMTRIGDTALLLGLFLLFSQLGTLDLQSTLRHLDRLGPTLTVAAALLVLGGATGKSAQIPLQSWLPDAMAGPTPVSALIHAATMVTAGVYLIARMHPLFTRSPAAMAVVAGIGAATALYGATSALAQRDLKRVLAYSTMSQVGYMFLALGVGAFGAAIFHFYTHAFFKALLFLAAGIIIRAQHEEHDIYRMGGLWRSLPVAGWTFLIGGASLAALPLVTAGFYSKDAVIWESFASPQGSVLLLVLALLASFLTALYIFRTFFLVFLGPQVREVFHRPGLLMRLPVIVLALLSLVAGCAGLPQALGGFAPLLRALARVFGPAPGHAAHGETVVLAISALTGLAGVGVAYLLYRHQARLVVWAARRAAARGAAAFFREGWGFDWLYDRAFVWPYVTLARSGRGDLVDYLYAGLAQAAAVANRALAAAQTGRVRDYATALLLSGVVFVALFLFLR